MTPSATIHHFLGLPTELRLQIYSRVCQITPILLNRQGGWQDPLHSLRATCKQTFADVEGFCRKECVFYLVQRDRHSPLPPLKSYIPDLRILCDDIATVARWYRSLTDDLRPKAISFFPYVGVATRFTFEFIDAFGSAKLYYGHLRLNKPRRSADDSPEGPFLWRMSHTIADIEEREKLRRCQIEWTADVESLIAGEDLQSKETVARQLRQLGESLELLMKPKVAESLEETDESLPRSRYNVD